MDKVKKFFDKRDIEDLLACIDLTLRLGNSDCNKQWFMELTDKLKEYEV